MYDSSATPGTATARPGRRRVLAAGAATAAAAALPMGTATAAGRTGTAAASAASATDDLRPYASYWFPDSLPSGSPGDGVVWRSLMSWTPESDPDLAFNTSAVPLASRFTPVAPNATARTGQARVSALAAFAPTAGNPSQGSATADSYALTHWAYLDELVFWGGSSGEGLILAPNAPVVDAAHRNGVPVLGTVFLPPVAYGGQLRWTRDLVQRGSGGGFPVADKLIQVAKAYGFDGWFINAETDGGNTQLATDMRDFLLHLRDRGEGLRVTWYDAMVDSGAVSWQNALNNRNSAFFRASATMFLNFDWSRSGLASSGRLAQELGRSRYELWAGIDVESRGYDTSVNWDAVIPADAPHTTGYGFYRPEWTWTSLPSGQRTPAAFHARDDRFWTGASLDPSAPGSGTGGWRAPAVSVADRSTVTALPFATSFNTGHGMRWYEEGTALSDTAWTHLGLQDRLPGRRWVVRTTGARPTVNFDFADAWRGGSSLLVDGAPGAPTTVELHSVRLPLSAATVVELAHRADAGSAAVRVELAVAVREPDTPGGAYDFSYLPAGTLRAGGGWTTATLWIGRRLRALRAESVRAFGVRLTPSGGGTVRWRLGALAVRDAAAGAPDTPGPLTVTASRPGGETGTAALRLSWGRSSGAVRHYELHQVLPGGGRRFLGGTCGTAFYVPALRRAEGERASRIEVRAVDELFTPSPPSAVSFTW
ncbi:endo-beta-N-acetylglucosaminidase [Streptomyces sp. NA02950]|uniref:endo-beta-N-acetylglucosaminidase n=1 Tax=Streptomyces sp. NA02950 TaxID=2742137 RepID=UPI00158FC842|nr:endo-beta-N-acetylglucosaminidase [Streptomyces sp. NA02950]QKV96843.1 endo-beta-N-acetylglucosaminidase [Streptomyces sp. NA02950]